MQREPHRLYAYTPRFYLKLSIYKTKYNRNQRKENNLFENIDIFFLHNYPPFVSEW